MLTTSDKALVAGIVSFAANWLLAHYQITVTADMQTAITGLIVGIAVWVSPNKGASA